MSEVLKHERPRVAANAFARRLNEYTLWREGLIEIIGEYQNWVEAQGLASGEDDLRIYELVDALRSDKLTIALVAEFSRGKTELINAIFFADHKQRLLPSDAGRTTMCPTELRYDEKLPPGVTLLPIETRASAATLAELKRQPDLWTTLPLEVNEPRQMAEVFREIVKTKAVGARAAAELGLHHPQAAEPGAASASDGEVAIPVWRHAIVNYPHPLLKQGLVVIDTPGLNALGAEPELTLGLLPKAHGVVFVLAADTGVTQSDLAVWNNHVCAAGNGNREGCYVVLNKIDALWDELRDDGAVESTLARQIEETARTLGVSRHQVFPVSAQKGLLGKIKADAALLERSGLPELELRLAADAIAAKQRILRDRITREIGDLVESTRGMIEARRASVRSQLTELEALSGKSQDAIQGLLQRMRGEREAYDTTLASFQASREVIADQIKILLDYLSPEAFDALTARARREMNASRTTQGLRREMKHLFDGALDTMEKAGKQAQQIRGLVQAVYAKFHTEHGLAKLKPVNFSLLPCHSQLQRLYEEAEAFRNSPAMVMTEQHFVVRKFFMLLVARTREIFVECHAGASNWSRAIMAPILAQVREHKLMMDQRLENLKQVHENLDNLSGRIHELAGARQNLENQLLVIQNMLRKIEQPLPLDA